VREGRAAEPGGEPAVWAGFDWSPERYEDFIRRIVPHYHEQDVMMADAIREVCPTGICRILELGAGTGSLARFLLESFPTAHMTAIDVSPAMVAECRRTLAPYGERVRLVEADLTTAVLGTGYQAVLSRLAIHHLDDLHKQDLFQRIFAALLRGGVLVDSDVIAGGSEAESLVMLDQWREYMRMRGDDPVEWEPLLVGEDDLPATERAHTIWLQDAGFTGVRVVWKVGCFAMFTAIKPGDV
jgi:tRNA (cmo5U34)-methyltransferase